MSFETDPMKTANDKLPYLVRCYIFIAEHEIDLYWERENQMLKLLYVDKNEFPDIVCISYSDKTKSLALKQLLEDIAKQNNWSI